MTHRAAYTLGMQLALQEKLGELQTELQPHQQRVVDRLRQQDGLLAIHGLGSGKTLTSLAVAEDQGLPATAVVPAALQGNYKKEIAKHFDPGTAPDINVASMQGTALRRTPIHTGTLIVDEAHRLRDASTLGARVLGKAQAEKRLLMTATPFYNHPSDIAMPLNMAAGHKVLPTDPAEFEKRYIQRDIVNPSFGQRLLSGVGPGEVAHVNPNRRDELAHVFNQYVDYHPNIENDPNFPRTVEHTVNVDMTPQQLEVYDGLLGNLPPWVSAKIRSGLPPTKQESKQLNAFLSAARQVANTTRGFAPNEAPQEPKIQRAVRDLQEMIRKNDQAKAVVYSNYLSSGLDPYADHLRRAHIPYGVLTGELNAAQKAALVEQYNANKIKALLISSAGGEGIDLKNTRMMQLLEPGWNEARGSQVEGRGVRFMSHSDLPEDQREVDIRRYIAQRPPSFLNELGLSSRGQAVDEYLTMLSAQKQGLIDEFYNLMPRENEQRQVA